MYGYTISNTYVAHSGELMASSRLGPCQYLILIAHTLPVLYANKQFCIVFICCMLGGDFLGNLVWLLYIALFVIMLIFIQECSDHIIVL